MATLVFPALTQAALHYLDAAQNRGERVYAASSVYDARTEAAFGALTLLPYVYDAGFRDAFLDILRENGITHVYAPVASVHAFLESFIAREHLPITLLGTSPIRAQVELYRRLRQTSAAMQPFIEDCAAAPDNALSLVDIEAIFRYAGGIYGESSDDKLAAMIGIFATAPKGDVIEIGSLMGKSACVLQYLSRRYETGSVLSVDPLSHETSIQSDFPAEVQNAMDAQWDYDILREAFVVNLLPIAGGRFNYLRMESERGFEHYRTHHTVTSAEFGEVAYTGNIAVIHIDGNHDLRHVKQDCELWLSRLCPGAWLILDDYLWAHGDGPYRVGNGLLETRHNDIDRAFVCGKALFVKFGPPAQR
ncbi:MAG TPA: class I SAM-dependent methyltransferase [Candidatus Baltobacteraceae bacterium]|nr:class I SAM-dependent methyltransferase [Candidatus Baltobacteraceae bacterium]